MLDQPRRRWRVIVYHVVTQTWLAVFFFFYPLVVNNRVNASYMDQPLLRHLFGPTANVNVLRVRRGLNSGQNRPIAQGVMCHSRKYCVFFVWKKKSAKKTFLCLTALLNGTDAYCKLQSPLDSTACSQPLPSQSVLWSVKEWLVWNPLLNELGNQTLRRWKRGTEGDASGEDRHIDKGFRGGKFTQGVEKVNYLALEKREKENTPKVCPRRSRSRRAGHKRTSTMPQREERRERKKREGSATSFSSSFSSALCPGRVSARWSRFTVWRCIGSCWQRRGLWR